MERNEKTERLVPTVGMPASYCIGCDSYAGEIVQVERNGRQVGFSEKGRVRTFSLRKNGRFYEVGCAIGDGGSLFLGKAEDRRDPSF